MSARPARIDVVGSRISACDAQGALDFLAACIAREEGGYVCFTNVHATVAGTRDPEFLRLTNESLLSLADGKPVHWLARANGCAQVGHVPGPDFLLRVLERFPQAGHFFYGASPGTLERLVQALRVQFPGLQLCGAIAPPFRPLTDAERAEHILRIRSSGARFVWVGLGAPKQERWMAAMAPALQPAILLGVGAAFDFHAGTVRRAPLLMRRAGLEWLHRLGQEPRRLWRRYFVTNSLFLLYAARHLSRNGLRRTGG